MICHWYLGDQGVQEGLESPWTVSEAERATRESVTRPERLESKYHHGLVVEGCSIHCHENLGACHGLFFYVHPFLPSLHRRNSEAAAWKEPTCHSERLGAGAGADVCLDLVLEVGVDADVELSVPKSPSASTPTSKTRSRQTSAPAPAFFFFFLFALIAAAQPHRGGSSNPSSAGWPSMPC